LTLHVANLVAIRPPVASERTTFQPGDFSDHDSPDPHDEVVEELRLLHEIIGGNFGKARIGLKRIGGRSARM